MIGLEHILHLYKIQHNDLANELGIAKQNISRWIKGERKIPKKYLPILSKKFNIPEEYFQKELDKLDETKIEKIKLENGIKEIEYKEKTTDPETGEKYTVYGTYSDTRDIDSLKQLSYEIDEHELYEKIKKSLDNYSEKNSDIDEALDQKLMLLQDYHKFVDIMSSDKINKDIVREIIKSIELAYKNTMGGDGFTRIIVEAIHKYDKKKGS